MDNKNKDFKMPENLGANIAAIMQNATAFIETVKTGEGLGLDEEQKKEFVKRMGENNSSEAVNELKDKIEQLKNAVSNIGKSNPKP